MTENQQSMAVSRAAEEAFRLLVKVNEGKIDRDLVATRVEAATDTARRLEGTGADFVLQTEHRSQNGSLYINVRKRRSPLAPRIAARISAGHGTAIWAAIIAGGMMSLVFLGLWATGALSERLELNETTNAPTVSTNSTTVVRFVDGDTLIVSSLMVGGAEERIRLLAIDTPERGQPYYVSASNALVALVGNSPVSLEFERPGKIERDKFGRVLAYLIVDGRNLNVEMVRQGWTAYVTKYGVSRFSAYFAAAEDEARSAQRGIWSSR